MTTSGSSDFSSNRDQIITQALCLLGVYRPGATIATADINICSTALNAMVKSLQASGTHVWSEVEGTVFLRTGISNYTLSSSSTDQAGDNCLETTVSSSSSGTSLTVTDSTGMAALDNIGVELDDGTREWTTISSVNSSTSITLSSGISSAASSGNTVFSYTTHIGKPLLIKNARFRDSSGNDIPVNIRGREDFMRIPSKSLSGSIISDVFYSPEILSGRLYVWQVPDNVKGQLKISYVRMLEDFDASGNTPDLPSEWTETLYYNLAVRISSIYGKQLSKNYPEIVAIASGLLQSMKEWDTGQGPLRFVPAIRYDY